MDEKRILLGHGSGGLLSHELIENLFVRHFGNPPLLPLEDAALLDAPTGRIAFTTDSYVVKPLFFPGGDIGRLSLCGTINDLSMRGAEPRYVSTGFIIEEGFPFTDLQKIVLSMTEAAQEAGVSIVCGDTKVVERGAADGLFINTAGIGVIPDSANVSVQYAQPGDAVMVSGTMGDHGVTIMSQRQGLHFKTDLQSDVAPLNRLVARMLEASPRIHAMRDPTRGGLATTLKEIALSSGVGIDIEEGRIPVAEGTRRACEMLGLDYLYLANEGKLVAVVPYEDAENLLDVMKKDVYGWNAAIVGRITSEHAGVVTMKNVYGVRRVVEMLASDQFPRIC
jgi:hydrogenase expression/formation protein HypE